MSDFIVTVIFLSIIIIPAVFILKKCFKANEKNKYQKQLYNASINTSFKHIEGLPVASGAYVDVLYGYDKITFIKDKQEASILMSKIISIDVVDGNNLKSQIVSGAIAGKYIIGGTAGALMGVALSTTMYIVITYRKNKEYKFIIFDTGLNTHHAYKIQKEFKQNNTNEFQSIEL